jgi:hypothetical protein
MEADEQTAPTSVSYGLLNENLPISCDRLAITVEFAYREGDVPIRMCTLPGVMNRPYPSPPYPWRSGEPEEESPVRYESTPRL